MLQESNWINFHLIFNFGEKILGQNFLSLFMQFFAEYNVVTLYYLMSLSTWIAFLLTSPTFTFIYRKMHGEEVLLWKCVRLAFYWWVMSKFVNECDKSFFERFCLIPNKSLIESSGIQSNLWFVDCWSLIGLGG